MPTYGGKRGQESEAEIVQRGGAGVIQAMKDKGDAEAKQIEATGKMVTEPIGHLASAVGRNMQQTRKEEFEREKMGAQMQHEQGMQREKVLGQSALQEQEGNQRQQQLKMELEGRAKENEANRQFQAATEGKVTFDKATGSYQPTEMAKQTRVAEHNLLSAKRTSILSEVAQSHRNFEAKMAEARMKQGQESAELEQKATEGMVHSIEKLADLEHKARNSMLRGEEMNPLGMGMSSEDVKRHFPGGKGDPESMKNFADQMRTARNAQAFKLAASTGDTSYIIPGSKEQTIFVNRGIPLARNVLKASSIMQQMANERGPRYAAQMINKIAATLTMMETADPDIAAALARAMQSSGGGGSMGGPQEQAGAQLPGSQPSSQPGARRGSGINIPREQRPDAPGSIPLDR